MGTPNRVGLDAFRVGISPRVDHRDEVGRVGARSPIPHLLAPPIVDEPRGAKDVAASLRYVADIAEGVAITEVGPRRIDRVSDRQSNGPSG